MAGEYFRKSIDFFAAVSYNLLKIGDGDLMKRIDISRLNENIEAVAHADLAENKVFGSSYAVCQCGEPLLVRHYGVSDPESRRATDGRTLYRLASMTKPVTGMAVLMLIERGILSTDTPIKQIIPEFDGIRIITPDGKDLGAAKNEITVLHLLTHTSGLGVSKPDRMREADRADYLSSLKYYISAGLDFEPFTKQAYSGLAAFDALGLAVERVTGEDFEGFCRREIFAPLGMSDTAFTPTDEQWSRVTAMHTRTIGESRIGRTYDGCVFEQFPASHAPAGAGLVSSLGDYMKFAEMLQNEGAGLVRRESFGLYRSALVPDEVMNNALHNWGFGVRVITSENYGPLPVGAFGWSGAYGSHFWVDPVNRITAVYMKNSRFDGGAGNMSAKTFEKAVFEALEG